MKRINTTTGKLCHRINAAAELFFIPVAELHPVTI